MEGAGSRMYTNQPEWLTVAVGVSVGSQEEGA
jgi:hypothetical protein